MKKLDNHGWGFIMFLSFLFIFMIALLMVVYVVNELELGFSSDRPKDVTYSQYENYKSYEKKIKSAALVYAKTNGYVDYINIGVLKIDNKIKSACDGYALLDSSGNSYTAYIKCGNYESSGYSSNY